MNENKATKRPENISIKANTPEIWGGIECTINRVGNNFLDQLSMSGHYHREEDIALIAELGVKKLRYPLLWERHEPHQHQSIDWSWATKKLNQIRQHHITPVIGLVHHGSGPSYTRLDNHSFAAGLARYARQVAEQFPWLEYYTPVNEPLTTARFSGLYGFWYPHKTSDEAFCTMLLQQLKGTVLAMVEIRKVNPTAKLVQTEDLAKAYSVPSLQYQADFENDRRWITFDLLCGKVDYDHPLWDFFIRSGIREEEILFFRDHPCPPDIAGFNYYVTSERFLDDRLDNYPECMHGGNWFEKYVDTEAVRVPHGQPSGLRLLLKEAYERYELPMAITECHLHCTSEEKMRWFREIWDICSALKAEGMPVNAVTAWSLFGAFGWNKLLTAPDGDYEPGVFDVRGGRVRKTAMAELIQSLGKTGEFNHPVLENSGWWHRCDRYYEWLEGISFKDAENVITGRPLLVVGNDMYLTGELLESCKKRALASLYRPVNGENMISELQREIETSAPWAVIFVDDKNGAPGVLEEVIGLCEAAGVKVMTLVKAVAATDGDNQNILTIQYGELFSATCNSHLAGELSEGETALSYVPDVVNLSLDLLIDGEKGVVLAVNDINPLMPSLVAARQHLSMTANTIDHCENAISERV